MYARSKTHSVENMLTVYGSKTCREMAFELGSLEKVVSRHMASNCHAIGSDFQAKNASAHVQVNMTAALGGG